MGEGIEPGVRAACRAALDHVESLGGTLVPVELPHAHYGLATYYLIAPAECSANLARFDGIRYGRRALGTRRSARALRAHARRGLRPRGQAPHHARHLRAVIGLLRRLLRAGPAGADPDRRGLRRRRSREVDVMASPTSPTVAFRLGERTADPLSMYLSDVCTIPVSLAGLPSLSIPCGLSDGLPVGLQLAGPAFSARTACSRSRTRWRPRSASRRSRRGWAHEQRRVGSGHRRSRSMRSC